MPSRLVTYAMIYNRKGFTLIEMMVSMAIFSIVMVTSVTAILAIIDANRKAQSLKSVVNNLNFTMETISRNIRVGTNLHCFNVGNGAVNPNVADGPMDCLDGGNALALEPQFGNPALDSDQVVYRFDLGNGAIYRHVGLPGLPISSASSGSGAAIRLTSSQVKIEHMRFYVDGNADTAEGEQPRVRMTISGYAEVGRQRTNFNLQTTVTQRILDL